MIIDFCGIPLDLIDCETSRGTQYKLGKWTCPSCGKECSMCEIDGEWCHGDGVVLQWRDGKQSTRCVSCWLDAEKT